ncbi:MAG: methionyl-tRNA formyltransferase, partial [Microgenomates group bacterium]
TTTATSAARSTKDCCTSSLRSEEVQQSFVDLAADVAVVVAYGLILPSALLSAPRFGCLNIHASLLPRWRGAAPIHRAIMAGDTETGICIMQMDEGLDTGAVLQRQTLAIGPEETTGALHDRLAELGAQMIAATLAKLPLVGEVQHNDAITYATKIDKAEARIDWTKPAIEVDRQIRALSPFPGAWCLVGTERVKLLGARLGHGSGSAGQVLGGLTIACGEGAIEITVAQREGKRAMAAQELLRGLTLPDFLA